ncbi:MAG: DUF4350 domain-containing protein [Acidimicrobiales bacterium]
MTGRGLLTVLVLAMVVIGLAALAGRAPDDDSFDPRSTAPAGARGLVEFLEAGGVDVSEGWPDGRTDVALARPAELSDNDAARLADWAAAGGHLVLLGEGNTPYEQIVTDGTGSVTNGPGCEIPVLDDVAQVSGAGRLVMLAAPADDPVRRCLGRAGSGWFVTERAWGTGRITTVASVEPFTNGRLDEADNAVLAGRLLAPDPASGSSTRLSFLYRPPPGPQDGLPLSDLVSDQVTWYGRHLLVVLGLLAAWAVRRFGDPVDEPPVVELPGSLSVLATGRLHQRNGDRAAAYRSTRRALVGRLRRHYRLSPDTPPEVLVDTISAETGLDPDRLRALITAEPSGDPLDDAAELDRVARRVLAPGSTNPVPRPPAPDRGADV